MNILKSILSKFKSKNKKEEVENLMDEQQTSKEIPVAAPIVPATPVEKKFEIAIYDVLVDEATGKDRYERVNPGTPTFISANSPKQLQERINLISSTGQKVKILREVKSDDQAAQSSIALTQVQPVEMPMQPPQPIPTSTTQVAIPPAVQSKSRNSYSRSDGFHLSARQPVKFYKVGDIEIKDDNGTLYQKQWMKLTDSEAANLRVINDKNNSIVSLSGKHLEMKRWIKIENRSEDDSENLEEDIK